MQLTKHHGLGNDFLVLLDDVEPSAALAQRLCDRRTGVGADGLIVGRPAPPDLGRAEGDGDGAQPADVVMVLRNADGSRAEMSGNGVRCLAQAVLARAGRRSGHVLVATDAGLRRVEVTATADPLTCQARVAMGPVQPGSAWPAELPAELVRQLGGGAPRLACLDVGNPHLVLAAAHPASVDLERFGPELEAHVPGGVNVEVIAPTAGASDAIELRVWERGAGITPACGTGATAAAAAAHRWGWVGRRVRVHQPGGDVVVTLGDEATLEGPATFVADVVVPEDGPPGSGYGLQSVSTDERTPSGRVQREVVHG